MIPKNLSSLFESFDKHSIKYALIKGIDNKDFLQSLKGEKDIDLLISEEHIEKTNEILTNLGFKKVLFPRSFDGIGFFIGYDMDSQQTILLHIYNKLRIGSSIFNEFHFQIETRILLNNTVLNTRYNIYTINLQYEFFLLLTRTLISKSEKTKDIARLNTLADLVKNSKVKLPKLLYDVYSVKPSSFLEIKYSTEKIKELKRKYRFKIIKYLLTDHKEKILVPYRIFNGLLEISIKMFFSILSMPNYLIRYPGVLVAFQGVDGSGKSTQINKIINIKFFKLTGVKRIYGGNNEYWIPGLNRACIFFENKSNFVSKIVKPFISVFSIIDRRLRLIPAFINIMKGKLVIFDRYFYDDLLQNIKPSKDNDSKLKILSKKLLMGSIGFTPSLTIYLDVDAEEAYKRKKDFPLPQVKEQIHYYKTVLQKRKEVKFVDANKSKNRVRDEIVKLICKL